MNIIRREAKIACRTRDSATDVSTESVFANMTLQTSYATSYQQSSKN